MFLNHLNGKCQFIKPRDEIGQCNWLPGYISEEMFVKNKPFYKAWTKLAKKEVKNAAEANEVLELLLRQP